MKDREVLCTLRRVYMPMTMLLFAAWGLMMIGMAIWGISDGFTTWRIPVWKMELPAAIFTSLFMAFWFGFILCIVWYALSPLQRVKITEDEVQICFGPVVLRRIPIFHIRTVVRTGDEPPLLNTNPLVRSIRTRNGARARKPWRMVLCTIPKEQLQQMSIKSKHDDLHTVSNRDMRKYVQKHFRYNRFWLEWSHEAEMELRKYLPAADFIL